MKPEDIMRLKELLPTSLGSDEIREQFARDILRRSVFSARMECARYLADVRDVAVRMLEGTLDQASARDRLEGVLERMGHSMDDEGGLKNPASIRRLDLILETQTQMAASVARLQGQTPAVVEEWPAWKLERVEGRSLPRKDWLARWNLAGQSVGWEGAVARPIYGDATAYCFLALKSSPIWQALGDGVGGFRDTLGNPFPPFAYSSGMGWTDVSRRECIELGLEPDGKPVEAGSLAPSEDEIEEVARRFGFGDFGEGL